MDGAIELSDVRKRYGPVTALDGASVSIRPGAFHGLVGPNGSGKTTLIRLVAGLERPTAGHLDRGDATVGFSFQRPRFYPRLTVRENLGVFRSLQADPPPAEWTETVVDALRLAPAAHRIAGDLSGGFRRKLDLAIALAKRPQFLLLDEPFAAVDDHSRRQIREFLETYRTPERTVLVSTHNVDAFGPALDRLTVLLDGEVRYDGEPGADPVARYRDVLASPP